MTTAFHTHPVIDRPATRQTPDTRPAPDRRKAEFARPTAGPRIVSVGTATPPNKYTQDEVLDIFQETDSKIRKVFNSGHIETRHLYLDKPADGGAPEDRDPALSGFVAADASSEQVMAVAKVNGANSGAFLGVVQAAYVMEAPVEMQPQVTAAEALDAPPVLEKERAPLLEFESFESDKELPPEVAPPLPVPPGLLQEEIGVALEMAPDVAAPAPEQEIPVDADSGYFVEGSAEPGQYVLIVVQGIARVNVDASAAPVQAGDTLVALGSGYATAAAQTQAGGLVEVVIGRALEALEAGKDAIYVLVNVR